MGPGASGGLVRDNPVLNWSRLFCWGWRFRVDADVIVVGAGLAGLVAAAEAAEAGRKVLLLDQEPEQSLGGQAWWSFGGLFLVDSPEQRRLGGRGDVEVG